MKQKKKRIRLLVLIGALLYLLISTSISFNQFIQPRLKAQAKTQVSLAVNRIVSSVLSMDRTDRRLCEQHRHSDGKTCQRKGTWLCGGSDCIPASIWMFPDG